MDKAEPSSQTPPLWPRGPITYAIAQLLIEFPFTDPQYLKDTVHEVARTVSVAQGPMALLRNAREIVRARHTVFSPRAMG